MKRRDLLKGGLALAGLLAVTKAGGRWLIGAETPQLPLPTLRFLSERQASIVVAAACAMVGPQAEADYAAGDWDPVTDFEGLLDGMAPDQRDLAATGLHLFEEWTFGLTGFSGQDRATQLDILAAWRISDNPLQLSVWGLIHAATTSSYGKARVAWDRLGYGGPCVPSGEHKGRPPGQLAAFEWDEVVP